jgi:hydroxymethylpyrimidine pyrophosphatase-like HAD family hydrolase
MVKMIFSDFDETLLNYHSDKNYFDNNQVEILRKLNEQ